jgi:hypothetical protein
MPFSDLHGLTPFSRADIRTGPLRDNGLRSSQGIQEAPGPFPCSDTINSRAIGSPKATPASLGAWTNPTGTPSSPKATRPNRQSEHEHPSHHPIACPEQPIRPGGRPRDGARPAKVRDIPTRVPLPPYNSLICRFRICTG